MRLGVRLFGLLSLVLALSACSLNSPSGLVAHSNHITAQYFVLNQPITILSDHARRFIQHGQLTSRFGFDRREPHCRLEVKTLSANTQTIQPDRFKIIRIRTDQEAIAQVPSHQFASTAPLRLAFNEDGPPEMMEYIELYLSSAKQPDVLRLVCAGALSDGNPADYPRNLIPTIEQINAILGDYGRVE